MNPRNIIFVGIGVLILIALIQPQAPVRAGTVAVIPIQGVISVESPQGIFATQVASSTQITRWIEQANADKSVQAILLEINSPGGSAVASDEIVRTLQRVDKPIVAWIRESGASGAYWIASEADIIVANPFSITGSIGVVASYLNFAEFIQRYNITQERLVAGEQKDLASPFMPLSDDQRERMQAKLDAMHEYFLDSVQEARNLTDEQRAEIQSAEFYIGIEAYQKGLVDVLGSRQEVDAILRELVGGEIRFSRYQVRRSALEGLFSAQPSRLVIQT